MKLRPRTSLQILVWKAPSNSGVEGAFKRQVTKKHLEKDRENRHKVHFPSTIYTGATSNGFILDGMGQLLAVL